MTMSKIFLVLFFISSSYLFATTKTLQSLGASGKGIKDDSGAIRKALLLCQNGEVLDGQGLIYLIENPIVVKVKQLNLINCKFVLGTTFDKQGNFNITSNTVCLTNIFVDGGRSSTLKDIEKWTVFSKESNVKSICPSRPDFFHINAMNPVAHIEINKFSVKNLHAFSALTVYSLGKVLLNNLNFENLSYKTFHIYHSNDDGKTVGGKTIVNNAYAKNVGLLPTKLLIDGKEFDRTKVPMMPQGAFNFIVSFGDYTAHNLEVFNYGSTAVTADRNENFNADSIIINNSTEYAFSNNPSAGMWFEKCKNATIENLKIKITARDKRDLGFDSSAMHIFSVGGKVSIGNLSIESGAIACLNKGLRGSLSGKCDISINNFTLRGNYKQAGAQFAILDNSVLSKIKIGVLKLESQSVDFYGIQNVTLDNVIGKTGNEHLNFLLPTSSKANKEYYQVKKSNLKQINVDRNVKNIKLLNRDSKSLIKVLN